MFCFTLRTLLLVQKKTVHFLLLVHINDNNVTNITRADNVHVLKVLVGQLTHSHMVPTSHATGTLALLGSTANGAAIGARRHGGLQMARAQTRTVRTQDSQTLQTTVRQNLFSPVPLPPRFEDIAMES